MNKKIIVFLIGFLVIPIFCFGAYRTPDGKQISNANVDEDGNIITKSQSQEAGWEVLQARTTAAYDIVFTSAPTGSTHVVVGKYIQNRSSHTLSLYTDLGTATTHQFDLTLSTSDSINDLITAINLTGYWTAILKQGCYGEQLSTGTSTVAPRTDNEGIEDGLQFDSDGKTILLSSGVAQTIYLNATKYIAYRKAPVTGKQHSLGYITTTSSWNAPTLTGGSMSIWEGEYSTACVTRISPYFPMSDEPGALSYFVFGEPFTLPGTESYAQEYIIYTPTYTVKGDLFIIGKTE